MLNAVMVSVVASFVATFSSFCSPVLMQNVVVLIVVMQNVVTMNAVYVKCRYAECRGTFRNNF
jgi:hypothetical protein